MTSGTHTIKKGRFHVGQKVTVDMGGYVASGVIIEDRGNLDVDGGRIWRVRVPVTDGDDLDFEVPEKRVTATRQ